MTVSLNGGEIPARTLRKTNDTHGRENERIRWIKQNEIREIEREFMRFVLFYLKCVIASNTCSWCVVNNVEYEKFFFFFSFVIHLRLWNIIVCMCCFNPSSKTIDNSHYSLCRYAVYRVLSWLWLSRSTWMNFDTDSAIKYQDFEYIITTYFYSFA